MKAVFIEKTGGPQEIQYGEFSDLVPTASHVLVGISAVSVNPIDP